MLDSYLNLESTKTNDFAFRLLQLLDSYLNLESTKTKRFTREYVKG